MTCFAYAVKKMVEQPMNVVLVFPTKEQGENAFWNNIENDGFKTIEHIPKQLIARQDNKNMKITLTNGSTFQILGTKDPDALRGANGKLYILSEFVDIDGYVMDIIEPVVDVNGGQIIVQSTPKIDGISGGTFKIMFDSSMKREDEFASLITAREYMSEEQLEKRRQKTIEKYGNDFKFRQEYLCDWGQASATSYYGPAISGMEKNGRIGIHPYDKNYPVYTAWDLGMSDSTAVTFFQYYKKDDKPTPFIIDYYETTDLGNEGLVSFIQSKPYNYGWHFLPHDAGVRDSDAITRVEKMRDLGLTNSSMLRRIPVDDGINMAVTGLPDSYMHEPMTTDLRRKLLLYKRKFNELTGDYLGPEHKSESHAADSVRYMFVALDQEFNKETCEMYLSQASQSDIYESETVTTHFL